MIRGVALPEGLDRELAGHLLRADRQEDLTFALWYPSAGAHRFTALIHRPVLPADGDRVVHGNAEFRSKYFDRALGEALHADAGLALIHSHPGPGWQSLSDPDAETENRLAGAAHGATKLPLVGMTLGTDRHWSARHWVRVAPKRYRPEWCRTVRVVGDNLRLWPHPALKAPTLRRELQRTVSTWGPRRQADVARTKVGVIGLGSVGSIVAEGLARMGVQEILLMDFDRIETVNLDRVLNAGRLDSIRRTPKSRLARRAFRRASTASKPMVAALEWSICEEEGFREALDCDILFSCVDRPWPRQVLNTIAFAHLIPVIDGGIVALARPSGEGVHRADWFVHTVAPGRRCLECLGAFDPGLVQVDRDGMLDDPRYIEGLPADHVGRRNENVFAFAANVASLELLQFLAAIVLPKVLGDPGQQAYHFVPAQFTSAHQTCDARCPYVALLGRGDKIEYRVTGRHPIAEFRRRCGPARKPGLRRARSSVGAGGDH